MNQQTIDNIKQRIDIVEVVSDFVSLKKKGTYLWACCPLHNEKTPSFRVIEAKQTFVCHGCGESGDAIAFIEKMQKTNFIGALKYLGQKYNVPVDTDISPEQAGKFLEKEQLYNLLEFSAKKYQEYFEQEPIALAYAQERCINQKSIETFGIGYSKNEWNSIEKESVSIGYSIDNLLKAGLVSEKEGKHYDRFRGRLMFPIHDTAGRVVGFGARAMKKDDNPKYLNSPETELYIKNSLLYGLFQAKKSIKEQNNSYLVEGYTDVISMHQNGIKNVVASSGTALTNNQARLIKRFTETVTILYDSDSAGVKATIKGIDILLAEGLNVKIIMLPKGEDPDSFVRKVGNSGFESYVAEKTKDFILYKASLIGKQADISTKSKAIKDIVESINKIPDTIKRGLYMQECSKFFEIELPKEPTIQGKTPPKEETKPTHKEHSISPQEKECIRLLIKYGGYYVLHDKQLWQQIQDELAYIEKHTQVYKIVIGLYREAVESNKHINTEYFLINSPDYINSSIFQLSIDKYDICDDWLTQYSIHIPTERQILSKRVNSCLLNFIRIVLDEMIEKNTQSLLSADVDTQIQLLEKHEELTIIKASILKKITQN
jgi:DNA primase